MSRKTCPGVERDTTPASRPNATLTSNPRDKPEARRRGRPAPGQRDLETRQPLARRDELDRTIDQLATTCPWSGLIARLRCLHGIDTLGAFGLCAEICNFQRFPKPATLSAYLGLVPSENTSGEKRRLGSITKAGSTLARQLLVEASYHYRRPPRIGGALMRRQDGAEAWIVDLSWRAQRRLHGRWQRLRTQRHKHDGIAAVAIARELSHFVWELAITE